MTISADDILEVTRLVTRKWTKQRKAEERGSRSRFSRAYVYSDRTNFTDVVDLILPAAYQHASGNGKYTVSKRQLFYACREEFRQQTGRHLGYPYFANTLLVQYLNRHPETESWKVTADPRGNLTIPNAGYEVRIPCGTVPIEEHLHQVKHQTVDPFHLDAQVHIEWPSLRAGQRYQGVLYIEKEGFGPVLKEAKIAQRYDLAILSCKGMSVVAARRFVDEVCAVGTGVPLLIAHDFDKAGFEIAQRLTTVSEWAEEKDRVTYRFKNQIKVYDLGLRLADVQKYQLQDERCKFSGHFAEDSPCTKEEKEFLRSGRRVELNAFSSPQFIEWLESKLNQIFKGKRLIPDDDTLGEAYHRAVVVAKVNRVIQKAKAKAIDSARQATIPKGLRRRLERTLKADPRPWDEALYDLVRHDLVAGREENPGDGAPGGGVRILAGSPTSRSLQLLRRSGFVAEPCERWLPGANVRRDLFHVGDVIACHAVRRELLLVQATSLSNLSARLSPDYSCPQTGEALEQV
jgi:hypothetical protein